MPDRVSPVPAEAALLHFTPREWSLAFANAQLLRLQLRAAMSGRRVVVVYARRAVFAS
jgi:hypothetical protein